MNIYFWFLECLAISILHDFNIPLTESLAGADVLTSVARLLHGEKVISDMALSHVTGAKESVEQQGILLTAVREAVQINHFYLQTFASVLMKFIPTVRIGKSIHEAYSKSKYI